MSLVVCFSYVQTQEKEATEKNLGRISQTNKAYFHSCAWQYHSQEAAKNWKALQQIWAGNSSATDGEAQQFELQRQAHVKEQKIFEEKQKRFREEEMEFLERQAIFRSDEYLAAEAEAEKMLASGKLSEDDDANPTVLIV